MKVARIMKVARAVAVFTLAVAVGLTVLPRATSASSGTPDGQACLTNQSCNSGVCVNGGPPGSHTSGVCCTPTTCAAKGANCGTIPNGTCPQPLECGFCTSPNTCGGGGTANVCGCTPTTCAATGANCGTIPDGCGGTLNCGICTAPNTCGGSGAPNACGCTRRTCADVGASSGTISDGCGGTLDCARSCTSDVDCSSTQTCFNSLPFGGGPPKCVPKVGDGQGCLTYRDCVSGCCCYEPGCPPTGFVRGFCTVFAECAFDNLGDLAFCPGSPCGSDQDCPGDGITQFCTGGICSPKQPNGAECQFSSGCFSNACCCPGASTSVCQDRASCAGCQCAQDSQCTSTQFCTGGFCRPKQDNGTTCQFSSGCVSGCCCPAGSTSVCQDPGSCSGCNP